MDAYRAIIQQIQKIENERLKLSEMGVLAANCPKCFGPPVINTLNPAEPQVLVCLDGNFQHKRHLVSSVPIPGFHPPRPGLFLDPTLVESKARFLRDPINHAEVVSLLDDILPMQNILIATDVHPYGVVP